MLKRVQEHVSSGWSAAPSFEMGRLTRYLPQTRGEEVHMVSCSACGVAHFCHAEHQKKAWRKGCPFFEHRRLCPILKQWRLVMAGEVGAVECRQALIDLFQAHGADDAVETETLDHVAERAVMEEIRKWGEQRVAGGSGLVASSGP